MEFRIPKLRGGSYFRSLLEPRRRSEKARLSMIQEAYVEGVFTRRVDDKIRGPGFRWHLQKPRIPHLPGAGRGGGEKCLGRTLDGGPCPYWCLDAFTQKVREGGRIVNARCLSEVELAISDAHQRLMNAIATVFSGASWQRCRTPCMAKLLTRVSNRAQPGAATMVRTIYQQLSPEEAHAEADRVVSQLREHFSQSAQMLEDALPDLMAFTAVTVSHCLEPAEGSVGITLWNG